MFLEYIYFFKAEEIINKESVKIIESVNFFICRLKRFRVVVIVVEIIFFF